MMFYSILFVLLFSQMLQAQSLFQGGPSPKIDITVMMKLKDDMNELKTQLQAQISSLEAKITPLETKITSLEAKITPLETKITTLEAKITPLEAIYNKHNENENEDMTDLKTQLQTQITSLEAKINQNNETDLEDIAELKREVTKLQIRITFLEGKYNKSNEIQATEKCQNGWITYGNSCYFFGKNYTDWLTAQASCGLIGGYLAEIESSEEHDFLTNKLKLESHSGDSSFDYWIGGTNFASRGNYIWINSKHPFTFAAWSYGKSNDSFKRCVELNGNRGFSWNDTHCSHNKYFICENNKF